MPHANHPDMPAVTDAHRRAAFCAMRFAGWTYDAAMADKTKRSVIECRAHVIRTEEWKTTQQRTVEPVRRCQLGLDGHPMKWATQMVPGPLVPIRQPDLLTNPTANAATP